MATLTPSELSALLGPRAAEVFAPSPAVCDTAAQYWSQFGDRFARALNARLRPLIRAAARVTPNSSHTLTAESMTSTHDARSVASVWQSSDSLESLAIVLSPPLVAAFVDRLLGGRSASSCDEPDHHRPLTDADQKLAARLTDAARQCVSDQVFTEAAFDLTEAWLPDCTLLRLSFELRFVQGGGALDLLFPLDFAETFAGQALAEDMCVASAPQQLAGLPAIPSRRSTVVAQFAETSISQSDLDALAIGDVLLVDSEADQSLRVLVDGRLRFHASAGTIAGRKGIRLKNSANTDPA